MPSDNTYVRFRQQQRDPLHVNSPLSGGNISGVQGSGSGSGSTVQPSPPTPTTQPSVNHSDVQADRLNNLTLKELLDSPGRAGLTRLDPKRPPGTLWFDDDSIVAATVRSIFERDFKEPHANWSQTSKATIDRWYETFAQVYNWDRSINKRVRVEFEAKLKSRMSDQVSRWKGNWKEKGDEAKPKWIDPDVWKGLVQFWQDPKSEKKSNNSRNARYHDPDGKGIYKHRSGQTSYKARARKRCEKTGETTPDFLELLDETHRKADGTFIDGKSEEIYKQVTSRIEEEESHMCSVDNPESTGSGGLSVHAKNKIFTEVAPRKKGRIYGVGSLQFEASSAHSGPMLPSDDPVILSQKLAAAEACIQSQAEKINSFDILFDYLTEKDPALAAILRRGSSTQTGQANPNEPPVSTAPEPEVANEETTAAAIANLATGSSPPSTGETALLDVVQGITNVLNASMTV
uniref:En/Spm-like transposon protein n=1 Tax=Arabidopsis thaliana TaxID=3702 RepID=O22966_ARATH|nr:En/Spm-like transposon protein [Arabidopsis thaliana]